MKIKSISATEFADFYTMNNNQPLVAKWIITLEWIAVACNLGFTYLYIQNNKWAFLLGFIAPIPIGILSWSRRLMADTLLQILYILLSIWGYVHLNEHWDTFKISPVHHVLAIVLCTMTGLAIGLLLKKNTKAARPFMDSIITSFSIWATCLMMQGCHDNWLYFIAIDICCVWLFWERGLSVLSGLYFIYLLMALEGYFQWGWIAK